MLRYIIDGWNLIHKIPSVKNSLSPKRDFILFIKRRRLTGSKNNKVTIVFDGKIDTELISSEKEFEITFSDERSADDIIRVKVTNSKNKRQLVVVSDDREVLDQAKIEGALTMKVKEFLNKADKAENKASHVRSNDKEISYSLRKKITDELRGIWLKD